jgi:hypothetical protein
MVSGWAVILQRLRGQSQSSQRRAKEGGYEVPISSHRILTSTSGLSKAENDIQDRRVIDGAAWHCLVGRCLGKVGKLPIWDGWGGNRQLCKHYAPLHSNCMMSRHNNNNQPKTRAELCLFLQLFIPDLKVLDFMPISYNSRYYLGSALRGVEKKTISLSFVYHEHVIYH